MCGTWIYGGEGMRGYRICFFYLEETFSSKGGDIKYAPLFWTLRKRKYYEEM